MSDPRTINYGRYQLRQPWPTDCPVQGGPSGIVVSANGAYRTAFVEAFPRNPDTFIRGEGATMEEAEDAAWATFERQSACDHSAGWDRRSYRNGAGFCKGCGMFASNVFDLVEIGSVCCVCGAVYFTVVGGEMYCAEHAPKQRPDGFIAGLFYELNHAADDEESESSNPTLNEGAPQ